MSWKRTTLFLLVLTVIIAFYYSRVYEPPSIKTAVSLSPEPGNTFILPLAAKESVNSIALKNSLANIDILINKTDDHKWRVVKPVDSEGESLIIDGFISLLRLSPRIRQLSVEGAQKEELGFDKPGLSICVTTSMRKRERCLEIGSQAILVPGSYAKWNDERYYFLVDQNFLNVFDKSVYSLRKKQIFTFTGKQISSIAFQSPKKEIVIQHSGKSWVLSKPVEATLGQDVIHDLLAELNSLFAKDFIDDQRWDKPEFGLQSSAKWVRIEFQDGSEQILIQGREAAGKDAYYAAGEGKTAVLLISIKKLDKIEESFHKLVS